MRGLIRDLVTRFAGQSNPGAITTVVVPARPVPVEPVVPVEPMAPVEPAEPMAVPASGP